MRFLMTPHALTIHFCPAFTRPCAGVDVYLHVRLMDAPATALYTRSGYQARTATQAGLSASSETRDTGHNTTLHVQKWGVVVPSRAIIIVRSLSLFWIAPLLRPGHHRRWSRRTISRSSEGSAERA